MAILFLVIYFITILWLTAGRGNILSEDKIKIDMEREREK
jgi:hypothetical protein